jgi:hypothetical protein
MKNDLGVVLSALEKIMTNPHRWNLKVDGRDLLLLRTSDLLDQNRFGKICVDHLSLLPNRIEDPVWRDLLRNLLESVVEIPAPEMRRTKKGK